MLFLIIETSQQKREKFFSPQQNQAEISNKQPFGSGHIMLLKSISLDGIQLKIFDIHFSDFLYEQWPELDCIKHGDNVFRRYEIHLPSQNQENNTLLAQVQINTLNDNSIEVKMSAIEVELSITHLFINTLHNLIREKWWKVTLSEDYSYDRDYLGDILNNAIWGLLYEYELDPDEYLKEHEIQVPRMFPTMRTSYIEILPIFFTSVPEDVRQSIMSEFRKKLPPIENYFSHLSMMRDENTERLRQRISEEVRMPQKPEKTDSLDKWFVYYHDMKTLSMKYTLRQLASDVDYDYSYIRKKHIGCVKCGGNQ